MFYFFAHFILKKCLKIPQSSVLLNFLIFILYFKILPENPKEFCDLMFSNLYDVTEGDFPQIPGLYLQCLLLYLTF